MSSRVLAALALSAVLAAAVAGVASAAVDKTSLGAFVRSCAMDTKGCHNYTHDIVSAAISSNYGCIPKEMSADEAGDKLLTWIKSASDTDPKYSSMPLEDVAWAGVDALWTCPAQ